MMVKGLMVPFLLFVMNGLVFVGSGMCGEISNAEIMQELKALKERISDLEEKLNQKDLEIRQLKTETVGQVEVSRGPNETEPGEGLLDKIQDRVTIGGLVEVGAAYKATNNRDGTDVDSSDINLTTVELGIEININDWANIETVFLYEDPFENDEEDGVSLDVGTLTIGNPEKCPFYLTAGKMYLPFGALLTHLPDDPLVDQPMTLTFGETSEKAALVGFEQSGFSAACYLFNGDLDESANDNTVESFGFDVNYSTLEDSALELLAGVSYISNVADSDGLTDYITGDDNPFAPVEYIKEYVSAFAAYLHLGYNNLFFDAEYMSALERFDPSEISAGGDGAKPSVWNIEAGYNWDWGKNLEMVIKYAGSDETEALGFAQDRYGFGFNQALYEGIIVSAAYYRDKFHKNDADARDDGHTLFGQIAVEF